ncbi:GMC family oxidoreductase N-terminal domain-containing protein [Xanthobacter sp. DSM 24535]|uniref:GMC family oxidoreductase n=1 Tax=Roseixanthobacter psychrophilus TaxID=3119917 RepID=UPI0037296EE6
MAASERPKTGADSYDYIIVGAGSAGCVLANRLSADPNVRVAIVEAGGKDDWIWFHIPVGYLFAIGNPRADWCFKTEPEAGLNGRALSYPRGKTIGGSSAINAMIYMRGQAADYDHWRQLGLPGWGWDDVLPLFKKHEDHFLGPNAHHSVGGEWHVEFPRITWPLLDKVRDAASEDGIGAIDDFNTGDNEGSCYFHVNQKRGLRWSAARGFLKPVLSRRNLELITAGHVEKVTIENNRATGIVLRTPQGRRTLTARREVVLAAGALGSPQLLMLSGIGPGAHLQANGIETVRDLPGVGSNLQDHLQLRLVFKVSGIGTLNERYHSLLGRAGMGLEYAFLRRGPLTMAPSQLGIFTRSDAAQERANLEFHVQPLSLDKFGDPLHRFPAFTMSVCNLRPTSRGTIRLKTGDAAAAPEIRPHYLTTDEDRTVAAQSIRVARRIVSRPALAPYGPEEILPGPAVGDDEVSLARAAGNVGTTIFHPVGTAKMGLPSDPMAVVDARLRVIGIDGLRVVDASIMPSITSGNTNSPSIMIGEKGAAMILEDARV